MLSQILPSPIDNAYHGRRVAIWLLIPVLFVKTGIAFGTIFNGQRAAQSADGIPLDTFGADAAQTIVALFAIWGLSQLFFTVLGLLALIRYRALIPFTFLLLLVEHTARKSILLLKPIARTGTPPGTFINAAVLLLMIIGFVLSLRWRHAPARH